MATPNKYVKNLTRVNRGNLHALALKFDWRVPTSDESMDSLQSIKITDEVALFKLIRNRGTPF